MPEFVNTSEVLGSEQAVLDGLVANTLLELRDNTVTDLRYAFYSNAGIRLVDLPNVTKSSSSFYKTYALSSVSLPNLVTMLDQHFYDCDSLANVDLSSLTGTSSSIFGDAEIGVITLPNIVNIYTGGLEFGPIGFDFSKKISFSSGSFSDYRMIHLVLRSQEMCTLSSSTSISTNSPLGSGYGYIYVPSDLVASYKTATNWSNYASQILPISSYPTVYPGTITDTWTQIFEAEQNGTYTSKYSVGDTKTLQYGTGYVLMQIVGMDKDTLSSDTSKTAPITWLAKGAVFVDKKMSDTQPQGWGTCDMRTYLRETVLPSIDPVVRQNIKEVVKPYRTKNPSDTTLTIADTIWLPSAKEVGITTASYIESSGAVYDGVFANNAARVKKKGPFGTGGTLTYYLRSAASAAQFVTVTSSGSVSYTQYSNNSSSYGFAFGFCT